MWKKLCRLDPTSPSQRLYESYCGRESSLLELGVRKTMQCSVPNRRSCSLSTNTAAVSFSFFRIEYPSVTKKISTLNIWKACGNDGIPNRVLRECAAALAWPAYSYLQLLSPIRRVFCTLEAWGNKIASRSGAPRPPMTDVGTETAFRLDERKHFRKSKHLLRSEVS